MPWYTVQVSYAGEKETSKSLIRAAKSLLGKGSDAFLPCVRGEGQGYRREFYLVEGYIFVRYDKEDLKGLMKLENSPFFDCIVTSPDEENRRQPVTMTQQEIDEMREKITKELENPGKVGQGDEVVAIDGDCRYLEGTVESVVGSNAQVVFDFHSRKKVVEMPLFCLRKVGDGDY